MLKIIILLVVLWLLFPGLVWLYKNFYTRFLPAIASLFPMLSSILAAIFGFLYRLTVKPFAKVFSVINKEIGVRTAFVVTFVLVVLYMIFIFFAVIFFVGLILG